MKKNILVVAISTMVAAPAFSQDNINPFADEKSGFYLGGALGAAQYSDIYNGFKDEYDKSNAGTKLLKYTKRNAVGKLFGGYRVNKYFALELDYLKMGEVEGEHHSWGDKGEYGAESSAKIDAVGIKGIAIYPVNKYFDVYASAGAKRWRVKETTENLNGNKKSTKKSLNEKGTSLTYGLGANYNLTNNITLGLQWERMNDIGGKKLAFGETDIDTYTASFQYNF